MQTLIFAETRTVIENIRWDTFVELAEQRRGSVPRMTFDEGVLELLTPTATRTHQPPDRTPCRNLYGSPEAKFRAWLQQRSNARICRRRSKRMSYHSEHAGYRHNRPVHPACHRSRDHFVSHSEAETLRRHGVPEVCVTWLAVKRTNISLMAA